MNTLFVTLIAVLTLVAEAAWLATGTKLGYSGQELALGVIAVLTLPGIIGGMFAIGATENI